MAAAYHDAIALADEANANGLEPVDVYIASVIRRETAAVRKKISRRKAAMARLRDDEEALFGISRDLARESAGAVGPEMAAISVVKCYMSLGMDASRVAACAKTKAFVVYTMR